ncbi:MULTISPECIES: alpha/beta hydrolase [Amycolatopsis]|uniref:alpha/beta hydrolase n=1 Tax=Amycolatopsis TaxID=1813 RepID=UPI001F3FE31F|nr:MULTISPECIES: alpha/beta hydrolase [Amycolatopsis]UKD52184.1 alpha/beta hydrolase [Amycolatopsis sp. FU40]
MRKQLFVALAAAALTVTAAPAYAAPPKSAVNWGACPADVAAPPQLQCASLDVPLDYRQPDGKKISIEISRLQSIDPAARRGVLLFNPGGPGGLGLTFPLDLVRAGIPASVLARYDLIGFDPRGVAHSSPVNCNLTAEQMVIAPKYAHNEADVVEASAFAKGIAQQCAASESASVLPYLTTANTARDMDQIRAALGESKISYVGYSYGTYLGGAYATLFPDQTDRVVLDSVLGPGGYDITAARRFAEGMQDRFPDFAKWAAVRNSSYGLGATPTAVTATFDKLADKLDETPVAGIDGSYFRLATHGLIYQNQSFPRLAQAWQALLANQVPSGAVPPAPTPTEQSQTGTMISILCGDNAWPRTISTYQDNVAQDRAAYPMIGASTANVWPCAHWPKQPIETPVQFSDQGPSNLLLVQNTRDPATPLSGALETRAQFGDRARMVTVDQGGHGAALPFLNSCGFSAVTDFLVNGTRPDTDKFCGAEASARGLSQQQQQAADKILDRMTRH